MPSRVISHPSSCCRISAPCATLGAEERFSNTVPLLNAVHRSHLQPKLGSLLETETTLWPERSSTQRVRRRHRWKAWAARRSRRALHCWGAGGPEGCATVYRPPGDGDAAAATPVSARGVGQRGRAGGGVRVLTLPPLLLTPMLGTTPCPNEATKEAPEPRRWGLACKWKVAKSRRMTPPSLDARIVPLRSLGEFFTYARGT